MKKILYILIAIFLFNHFTTAQWVQQVSGVTLSLLDIDFINENTGWGCGDNGVILKTTNSGVNWIQQSSGVTKRLEGIEAIDANNLWCVGWWQTILKSTNGGTSWIIIRNGQQSPPDPSFLKVFFLNINTGWLLRNGTNGYILRTTNGGNTFDSASTVYSYLNDIYFKDSQTGILCGDGALIMRSTNGGVNWVQISLPLETGLPNFYRMGIVNNINAWVVGEGGIFNEGRIVWRSTNFGSSWDSIARVPYPGNQLNYSVFFTSLNTGYCGGTFGYTFKTTNGGFNWYQQNVPIDGFRNDFWFTNDTVGWVAGGGGYILKTTNGGTYLSVEPVGNSVPDDFALYQNYPNPFNPVTNIKFEIPNSKFVSLKIYDLLGREVDEIVNENLKAGTYKTEWNASAYPSGIYFYRLISDGNTIDSKKMILLK